MSARGDTDAVAAGVLDLLALGETPDLDTVLERIVRAARRQVVGAVRSDRRSRRPRRFRAIRDVRESASGWPPPSASCREPTAFSARSSRRVRSCSTTSASTRASRTTRRTIRHSPTFSACRSRTAGTVLGNLFVSGHASGHFTRTDARKLETLAAYAGVAIANAELYARSQQLAVVEERNRVARELHDAATQTLFSLVLAARAAALSTSMTRRRAPPSWGSSSAPTVALQELRGLVHALRPKSLERDGLAATLGDHADALRTSGARRRGRRRRRHPSPPRDRARAAPHRAGGAAQRDAPCARLGGARHVARREARP